MRAPSLRFDALRGSNDGGWLHPRQTNLQPTYVTFQVLRGRTTEGLDELVVAGVSVADGVRAERKAEIDVLQARLNRIAMQVTALQEQEATKDAVIADLRRNLAAAEARAGEQTDDTRLLEEKLAAALATRLAAETTVDDTRDKLAAALAAQKSAEVRLQNLGSELNSAIARVAQEERRRRLAEEEKRLAEERRRSLAEEELRKVEEQKRRLEEERAARLEADKNGLARFRSELFGRLSEVIGDRGGIRVSGERFVLSSESLFQAGKVELSAEGRAQIEKLSEILPDIVDALPEGIDWMIAIEAHTDNQPIRPGGRYADNREFSQARALSVLRAMIEGSGLPPHRISATGHGGIRPVDPRDTPEARRKNRRIEILLREW